LQQSEKVPMEDEAKYSYDEKAAQPDVNPAYAAPAAITAIFNIVT
jgi:hypothetical protein